MAISVSVIGNAIPAARRIRIVAPASRPEPHMLEACKERLSREGFHVDVDPRCLLDAGWTAGPDDQRLAALSDALLDPDVDTILCARGGFGSPKIADQAPAPVGRKTIIGYSDITYLLVRALGWPGVHSVHGPLASEFINPDKAEGVDLLVRLLKGEDISESLGAHLRDTVETICPGVVEGELAGGNLSTLQLLAGAPAAQALANRVLVLEEIGERMYEIDRALDHLRRAGILGATRGLLLGSLTPKAEDAGFDDHALTELVARLCRSIGKPAYRGLPVGHGRDNAPFVFGTRLKIG